MMNEWPDERLQKSELKTLSDFQQELTTTEHIINISNQLQNQNQPTIVPPPPGGLGVFCFTEEDTVTDPIPNQPLNIYTGTSLLANQLIVEEPLDGGESSEGGESDSYRHFSKKVLESLSLQPQVVALWSSLLLCLAECCF